MDSSSMTTIQSFVRNLVSFSHHGEHFCLLFQHRKLLSTCLSHCSVRPYSSMRSSSSSVQILPMSTKCGADQEGENDEIIWIRSWIFQADQELLLFIKLLRAQVFRYRAPISQPATGKAFRCQGCFACLTLMIAGICSAVFMDSAEGCSLIKKIGCDDDQESTRIKSCLNSGAQFAEKYALEKFGANGQLDLVDTKIGGKIRQSIFR